MNRILILPAALLLAAFGPDGEPFAPYAPPPPPSVLPANGAIFQAGQGYAPLTTGQRASMPGDLVTIVLVERTQAQKTSVVGTDRGGNFGLLPPSTGPLSLIDPSDVSMGGNQEFSGRGQAQQSNALFGEVTVVVREVYPNGVMRVEGEKRVYINRGDEVIRIAGLVRQADVGPENRVASTRVADAEITYAGRGDIARASRQGWLQRFFQVVSPF